MFTVVPAVAVPVNFGIVAFVMLSELNVPLSNAASRSGVLGGLSPPIGGLFTVTVTAAFCGDALGPLARRRRQDRVTAVRARGSGSDQRRTVEDLHSTASGSGASECRRVAARDIVGVRHAGIRSELGRTERCCQSKDHVRRAVFMGTAVR